MVAQTISLPNIRKMFKADKGYCLVEGDLERADAQVVAWDAGDEALKAIFKTGLDMHTVNAQAIFRSEKINTHQRDLAKKGVHAVNYGVKARTLAASLGISLDAAQKFIDDWLHAHPAIKHWHDRIDTQLMLTRQVTNIWGFRRYYFDRIETLLPQALAFIGQSTVAITINKALLQIHSQFPSIQLLLQVHDSLLMQVPNNQMPATLPKIKAAMEITIPYPDPLTIPINLKWSSTNWGDMKEWHSHDGQEKDK